DGAPKRNRSGGAQARRRCDLCQRWWRRGLHRKRRDRGAAVRAGVSDRRGRPHPCKPAATPGAAASGSVDCDSSIGSGGSMNRSLCRVMMGVAGLAVLGMTATLAGAQTDEVKPAPSPATQISEIPDKFVMPEAQNDYR